MRKLLKRAAALVLTAAMLTGLCLTASAAQSVTITLDGKVITTEAYVDSNDRTQAPAAIAEALGMTVTADGAAATYAKDGVSVTFRGTQAGDTAMDTQTVEGYVPIAYLAPAFGYGIRWDGAAKTVALTSPDPLLSNPAVAVDTENKTLYAANENAVESKFGWYTWNFDIDPAMDTVGETGDGQGLLRFRLFTPENVEAGKQYPLVAVLGGLGGTNAFADNGYASSGEAFAYGANQSENPSYVLTITVPFEACVNYEAEMAYIYEFGEIIKAVSQAYGNVDMDRIYATGHSQGAGWSYELIAAQPDLLAAALINAGTTVHTTWGNQCDMDAIAGSDVNLYIWHGYIDPYIPVNEAYRTYNTLTGLGKTNIIMEIDDCADIQSWGGHCNISVYSTDSVTPYMQWLYDQTKGVPCTETPQITEDGGYADYHWAGVQVLPAVEGWATANDYASWVEPADNATWDQIKAQSALVKGEGGTGKTWLSKIRIGDETATSYDDATTDEPTVTIQAGDTVAVTVQGYTGGYGDDWDAFNKEWSVDWAVLKGSVTGIELTHDASAEPILRPASVSLANGGGPNVNNSLYNENTLDGRQVYVKIDTAKDFQGDTLSVAIRFTRTLENGEYASYWHVVNYNVA